MAVLHCNYCHSRCVGITEKEIEPTRGQQLLLTQCVAIAESLTGGNVSAVEAVSLPTGRAVAPAGFGGTEGFCVGGRQNVVPRVTGGFRQLDLI
jgi:hypothetical protein